MNRRDGFSLVEVVVAVGVFVAGVVGAIALLSSTTNSASATLDANGAVRIAESASALLGESDWEDVLGYLSENSPSPIYATKGGDRIGLYDTVGLGDAYYQIELHRLIDISPDANDATAGYLAFELRVNWPVRQGGAETVPMENRESFRINMAINR